MQQPNKSSSLLPQGTYRASLEETGGLCTPCPEGTWSKNWGLREKGECIRCAPGVICDVEGMTNPCSYSDLPTPYEPIVNFNGMPTLEYEFPQGARPPPYSMDECLALNSALGTEYFYGELVPPYIDILGRGPHFRQTDPTSLRYQSEAKCYRNGQPHGSLVYQRMADYHGYVVLSAALAESSHLISSLSLARSMISKQASRTKGMEVSCFKASCMHRLLRRIFTSPSSITRAKGAATLTCPKQEFGVQRSIAPKE